MEIYSIRDALVYHPEQVAKQRLFQEEGKMGIVINLSPGQSLSPHKHPGFEVSILVLTGQGNVIVDDESLPVSQHDFIRCTGDELFGASNTGAEPMSLLVLLQPE